MKFGDLLQFTPEDQQALIGYIYEFGQKHFRHKITSGTYLSPGTHYVWTTYCETCKKIVGMAMISDDLVIRFLSAQSNLNDIIGSLLENWCTREIGLQCRFCGKPVNSLLPPAKKFCDKKCAQDFKTVLRARLTIGIRDLEQRGFD